MSQKSVKGNPARRHSSQHRPLEWLSVETRGNWKYYRSIRSDSSGLRDIQHAFSDRISGLGYADAYGPGFPGQVIYKFGSILLSIRQRSRHWEGDCAIVYSLPNFIDVTNISMGITGSSNILSPLKSWSRCPVRSRSSVVFDRVRRSLTKGQYFDGRLTASSNSVKSFHFGKNSAYTGLWVALGA